MEKSKYLELARQKGWDTQIPQLEDGTYNCDVFGGDDVNLTFKFTISGTLYLKDNIVLNSDVSAHDGIILGDNAGTIDLSSNNGDVIIGDNSYTFSITGRNIICGDNLTVNGWKISSTDGFVILGKGLDNSLGDDYVSIVSATEDIICDDEPSAESN